MSKAPAVDYALDIVEFFTKTNCEIGISDISNALNINKNAVSRVLEALLEKNWIHMSDIGQKKYKLTLRPFSLISGNIKDNNMVKLATPILEQLNKKLGDSVYLGVKNGSNVLYLIHCDSKKDVRINGCVGGEYPLNCSAPGKIILSQSDDSDIKSFFSSSVTKRTENTITSSEAFLEERDRIKKVGYAVDNEEFAKGIICIAVPIFDHSNTVVASIGISSLTLYDSIDCLKEQKIIFLQKAADEISRCLGANI